MENFDDNFFLPFWLSSDIAFEKYFIWESKQVERKECIQLWLWVTRNSMWLSVVRFHFCNDVFSWWNSIFFLLCISFLYLNVKKQSKKPFLVECTFYVSICSSFVYWAGDNIVRVQIFILFLLWKENTNKRKTRTTFYFHLHPIQAFDIHRTQKSVRCDIGRYFDVMKHNKVHGNKHTCPVIHSDKGSPLRESLHVTWVRGM